MATILLEGERGNEIKETARKLTGSGAWRGVELLTCDRWLTSRQIHRLW
ncbi:MAG: hypothetical protein NT159_06575 [Proteobacteria bacterium]|nr:hypothetical protein [Pseudomonadota bacterium]